MCLVDIKKTTDENKGNQKSVLSSGNILDPQRGVPNGFLHICPVFDKPRLVVRWTKTP